MTYPTTMQPEPRYASLTLQGKDAAAFAQAQFGSDIAALEPGSWQWSCWLDPKGRVRALFLLERQSHDAFRLWLRGGDAAMLARQLSMYLLRAQADVRAGTTHAAVDHAAPRPLYAAEPAAGCTVLGFGDYAVSLHADDRPGSAPDSAPLRWPALDIARGYPWLPQAALGEYLSPSLSLRRLQATSLTKGCFPGQEIATRLHYRGGNKRHLCRIESPAPITSGEPLLVGDTQVGRVLQSIHDGSGADALAVLHESACGVDTHALRRGEPGVDAPLRVVQCFTD